MPVRSDDPLRRVTLNLYEADCELMDKLHGHGWTTTVRNLVNGYCNNLRLAKTEAKIFSDNYRRTLGDLADDQHS